MLCCLFQTLILWDSLYPSSCTGLCRVQYFIFFVNLFIFYDSAQPLPHKQILSSFFACILVLFFNTEFDLTARDSWITTRFRIFTSEFCYYEPFHDNVKNERRNNFYIFEFKSLWSLSHVSILMFIIFKYFRHRILLILFFYLVIILSLLLKPRYRKFRKSCSHIAENVNIVTKDSILYMVRVTDLLLKSIYKVRKRRYCSSPVFGFHWSYLNLSWFD